MRVAPWVVNAVASSSRSSVRPTARCQLGHAVIGSRYKHQNALSTSLTDIAPPPPKGKGKGKRREDIRYDIGGAGQSNDKMAYFQKASGGAADEGGLGADWVMDGGDPIEGIETGRVVECRR